MILPQPKIIDATCEEAVRVWGADCVMIKHDGFPVVINIAGTTCNIFTNAFGKKDELVESLLLTVPDSVLLVGAKNPRTGEVFLYDTWGADGQSHANLSYRERYVMTRIHAKILKDPRFRAVDVFPIIQARRLWAEVIQDPVNKKGLVFRNSKDTAEGTLLTMRYYDIAPTEFK